MAKAKSTPVDSRVARMAGEEILRQAQSQLQQNKGELEAILENRWDTRTKEFLDYWFLPSAQLKLLTLIAQIERVKDAHLRLFLEVVFSSIIITKSGGVSMALDLGHTRPHRARAILNKTGELLFEHAGAPKQIDARHTLMKARSDRAQNTRTEALTMIRYRKGPLPHILAVTAEPLPSRISSLALGTGDLDCVYHFALLELERAVEEIGNVDQLEILRSLVEGHRLRDISDLPFDLAV